MDILKIVVGELIKIAPDQGDTVTAYSRAEKNENIGKLNKGELYQVHKINVGKGMIELEPTTWPASLHPVAWGGVWIDARFVEPENYPVPEPEPEPAPTGNFEAAIVAGVEAFLKAYKGG